jgi:hypothetical protein
MVSTAISAASRVHLHGKSEAGHLLASKESSSLASLTTAPRYRVTACEPYRLSYVDIMWLGRALSTAAGLDALALIRPEASSKESSASPRLPSMLEYVSRRPCARISSDNLKTRLSLTFTNSLGRLGRSLQC